MTFRIMEQASAIEKALDVLFHLHAAPAPQGVSDVGRALGLPKSSAHRLLAALGRRGLVERDEAGRYRPGIALVALGLGTLAREPVVEAARPVLEREAEALGETLFLAAARAGRIHVLDKVEGSGFLRAAPRIGSAVPAHATAVGKLYLALAPEAVELDDERALERFTARTLRGRGLAEAIARARRRGWSENREEWLPGLVVVAAPVTAGSRMVAALAAAAPAARLPESEAPRTAVRLVAAARRIAERLSGVAT
jgi:DNA-binding IclR family transcriptional regulator